MLSGINRSLKKTVAAVVAVMTLVGGTPIEPITSVIANAKLTASAEDALTRVPFGELTRGTIIAPGTEITSVPAVKFAEGGYQKNSVVCTVDDDRDVYGKLMFSPESGAVTLGQDTFTPYNIADAGTVYWEVLEKTENGLTLCGHAIVDYFIGNLKKNPNLGDNEVIVETNGKKETVISTGTAVTSSDVQRVIIKANVPLDFYGGNAKLGENHEANEEAFIQQIRGDEEYAYQYAIVGTTTLDEINVIKEPELLYQGKLKNSSQVAQIEINGVRLNNGEAAETAEYFDVAVDPVQDEQAKNQLVITSDIALDIFGDTGDSELNETVKLFDSENPNSESNKFVQNVESVGDQTVYKYVLVKKVGDDVNEYIYLKKAAASIIDGTLTNNTEDAVIRYVLNDKLVPVSAQEGKNVSEKIVVNRRDRFVIASSWPLIIKSNEQDITALFDEVVNGSVPGSNLEYTYGLSKNYPYAYVLKDTAKTREDLELSNLVAERRNGVLVWSKNATIKNQTQTTMDMDGETIKFVGWTKNGGENEVEQTETIEYNASLIEQPRNAYPLPYISSKVQLSLTDEDGNELVDNENRDDDNPVFKLEMKAVDDTVEYRYVLIPQRDEANGTIKPYTGTVTAKKASMNRVFDAKLLQEKEEDSVKYLIKNDDDSTTPPTSLGIVPEDGDFANVNVPDVEVYENQNLSINSSDNKPLYFYEKTGNTFTNINDQFDVEDAQGAFKDYQIRQGMSFATDDKLEVSGAYRKVILEYINGDHYEKLFESVPDRTSFTLNLPYTVQNVVFSGDTLKITLGEFQSRTYTTDYAGTNELLAANILRKNDKIRANDSGSTEIVLPSGKKVQLSANEEWTFDGNYYAGKVSAIDDDVTIILKSAIGQGFNANEQLLGTTLNKYDMIFDDPQFAHVTVETSEGGDEITGYWTADKNYVVRMIENNGNQLTIHLQDVGNGTRIFEYPVEKLVRGTILYPNDKIIKQQDKNAYTVIYGSEQYFSGDNGYSVTETLRVTEVKSVPDGAGEYYTIKVEKYQGAAATGKKYTLKPQTGDITPIFNPVIAVPERDVIFTGTLQAYDTKQTFNVTYQENGVYGNQPVTIDGSSDQEHSIVDHLSFQNHGATKLVITSATKLDFITAVDEGEVTKNKVITNAFVEREVEVDGEKIYVYTYNPVNNNQYKDATFKVRKHVEAATFTIKNTSSYDTWSDLSWTDNTDKTIDQQKLEIYNDIDNNAVTYANATTITFNTPAKCKFKFTEDVVEGTPTEVTGVTVVEVRNRNKGYYTYTISANGAIDGKTINVIMEDDIDVEAIMNSTSYLTGVHNGFPVGHMTENGQTYLTVKDAPNREYDYRWYAVTATSGGGLTIYLQYKQVGCMQTENPDNLIPTNQLDLQLIDGGAVLICVAYDSDGEIAFQTHPVYVQKEQDEFIIRNGYDYTDTFEVGRTYTRYGYKPENERTTLYYGNDIVCNLKSHGSNSPYLLFDADRVDIANAAGGASTPIIAIDPDKYINHNDVVVECDGYIPCVSETITNYDRKLNAIVEARTNTYIHMLKECSEDEMLTHWELLSEGEETPQQIQLATMHHIQNEESSDAKAYMGYDIYLDDVMVKATDIESIQVKQNNGDDPADAIRRTFNGLPLDHWYAGNNLVVVKSYNTLDFLKTNGSKVQGNAISRVDEEVDDKTLHVYTLDMAQIQSDVTISHTTSLTFYNPKITPVQVQIGEAEGTFTLETMIYAIDNSASNGNNTINIVEAAPEQKHYYGQNIAYMVSPTFHEGALDLLERAGYTVTRTYDNDTYAKLEVVNGEVKASTNTSSVFPTEVGTYLVTYTVNIRKGNDTSTESNLVVRTIFTINQMPMTYENDVKVTLTDGGANGTVFLKDNDNANGLEINNPLTYNSNGHSIGVAVKQLVRDNDGNPVENKTLNLTPYDAYTQKGDYKVEIYKATSDNQPIGAPIAQPKDAGKYVVRVSGTGENYTNERMIPVQIARATVNAENIDINAANHEKVYDGGQIAGLEFVNLPTDFVTSRTSTPEGEGEPVTESGYTYRFKKAGETSWTNEAPRNVGQYVVEITARDLNGNYNSVTKEFNIEITRRPIDVTNFGDTNTSVYHTPLKSLTVAMTEVTEQDNGTGIVAADSNLDFSKYFAVYKGRTIIPYGAINEDAGKYEIGLVDDNRDAVNGTTYEPTAEGFSNYVINFTPTEATEGPDAHAETKYYTITPADISKMSNEELSWVLSVPNGFVYDTTMKSISFKSVTQKYKDANDQDKTYNLRPYTDFTISGEITKYQANDDKYPKYQVLLIGRNNYTGQKSVEWKIKPAALNAALPDDLTKEYDGKAVDASISYAVTGNSAAIQKDLESNAKVTYIYYQKNEDGEGLQKLNEAPSAVGSYRVEAVVTCENYAETTDGKNNAQVTFRKDFEIKKAKIQAALELSSTSVVYGEPHPTVENVVITGGIVEGDKDAVAAAISEALTNANTENKAGEYNFELPVSFSLANYEIDELTGTNYTITPKSISKSKDITVTLSTNASKLESDGSVTPPTVTVTDGEKTLVKDKDYRLTVPTDISQTGTYSIEVRGIANYGETVALPWIVYAEGQDLVNSKVVSGVPALVEGETNKFEVPITTEAADEETIVEAGFIWTYGTLDTDVADQELVVNFTNTDYNKMIVQDPNHPNAAAGIFTDVADTDNAGNGKGVTYRAYAVVTKAGQTYTVYGGSEKMSARDLIGNAVSNATSMTLTAPALAENSSKDITLGINTTATLNGFTVKESGICYVAGVAEDPLTLATEGITKWTKDDEHPSLTLTDSKANEQAKEGQGFTVRGYVIVTDGVNDFTYYSTENETVTAKALMEQKLNDVLTITLGDAAVMTNQTNKIKVPVTASVDSNYADFTIVESGVYYTQDPTNDDAVKITVKVINPVSTNNYESIGNVINLVDKGKGIKYTGYMVVTDGVNTYEIQTNSTITSARVLLGDIEYAINVETPALVAEPDADTYKNIEFTVDADPTLKGFGLKESGIRYIEAMDATDAPTVEQLKSDEGTNKQEAVEADNKQKATVTATSGTSNIYYIGYAIYSDGSNTYEFYSEDVKSVNIIDLLEKPVKAASSIKVEKPNFDTTEKKITFNPSATCEYPGYKVSEFGVIYVGGKENTEFTVDNSTKVQGNVLDASAVKGGITYKGYAIVTDETFKEEFYVYTDAKYINPSDISMEYVEANANKAVELLDESRVLNEDGTIGYQASAQAILDLDDFNAEVTQTGILWIGLEQYGLKAENEKVNVAPITDNQPVVMKNTGKGISYRAYAIITAGDQSYTVYSPTKYVSNNDINAPVLTTSVSAADAVLVTNPTDETYRDVEIMLTTNTGDGFEIVESGIYYSTTETTAEALKNAQKQTADGGLVTIKAIADNTPINYIGYVTVKDKDDKQYTIYTNTVKTVKLYDLLDAAVLNGFSVTAGEPQFDKEQKLVTIGVTSSGEYDGLESKLDLIYVTGETTDFTNAENVTVLDDTATFEIAQIPAEGISYKARLVVTDKAGYVYTLYSDAGYINKHDLVMEVAKDDAVVETSDPEIAAGETKTVNVTASYTVDADYDGTITGVGIIWRNGRSLDLGFDSERSQKVSGSGKDITASMTDDGNGISYRAYIEIKSGNKKEYKWTDTQYITSKELFGELVANGGVASAEAGDEALAKSGTKDSTTVVTVTANATKADAYATKNVVRETGVLVYMKETADEDVELLTLGKNGVTAYAANGTTFSKSIEDQGNGFVYRPYAVIVDENENEYVVYADANKEVTAASLIDEDRLISEIGETNVEFDRVQKNDGTFQYTYEATPGIVTSNYDVTIVKTIQVKNGDEWEDVTANGTGSFDLTFNADEELTYRTVVTASNKNGELAHKETDAATLKSEDAFNAATADLELAVQEQAEPTIAEDTTNQITFSFVSGGNDVFDVKTGVKLAETGTEEFSTYEDDGNAFTYTATDASGRGFDYKGFVTITDGVNEKTVESDLNSISARDLIGDDVEATITVTMSEAIAVDDGKNNKMKVNITGAVDYEGFSVKKTGILIVEGEQDLSNATIADYPNNVFSADSATYAPSFRDKSGNGYSYKAYVIVTDGTNDFVSYSDPAYAKASVIFEEKNILNALTVELSDAQLMTTGTEKNKLNKMKVQITSDIDKEKSGNFDITKTGIIIGEGDLRNLEFTLEAAEADGSQLNQFDTDGSSYTPSFRDKDGNGYTYVGYVTASDGTKTYTKYTAPTFVKAEDLLAEYVANHTTVEMSAPEFMKADSQQNKARVTINSSVTLDGFEISRTGILIVEGEQDLSNATIADYPDNVFSTNGAMFTPSFRDKSGNGYSYKAFAIVTKGDQEFTVYSAPNFVKVEDLRNQLLS